MGSVATGFHRAGNSLRGLQPGAWGAPIQVASWAPAWSPSASDFHLIGAHRVVDSAVLSLRNFRKEILFIFLFYFVYLYLFTFEKVIISVQNSLGYVRRVYNYTESLRQQCPTLDSASVTCFFV